MRILIFGDSITYGAWDSHGGWADRIKEKLHQHAIEERADPTKTYQVYNMGISGDTSTGLLSRMEAEIVTRKSATRPYVLLISIGTNDAKGNGSTEDIETTVEAYESNIRQLLQTAKKYTDKVIAVGLPPLPVDQVVFLGMYYMRNKINDYNEIFKKVCGEEGVEFIDIFSEYLAFEDVVGLYSEDKLHPSSKGHELLAEAVWPKLQMLLTDS